MTSTIAILGASGLVARSIISELGASDERNLVFVGRDQGRLNAGAPAGRAVPPLTPPVLVLNLVGPSPDPAPPVLEWCLRNGAHYCDVANELDAFEHILARD